MAVNAGTAPTASPVEARLGQQVDALLQRPYRMIVQGEPEDGYLAVVPELPGCMTAGDTPEEAMRLLRDAMAGWLETALRDGSAIPDPLPAINATDLWQQRGADSGQ